MNGPEHYCKAEGMLARLDAMERHALASGSSGETYAAARTLALAEAQVHATLALAAATAFAPAGLQPEGDRAQEWREVVR